MPVSREDKNREDDEDENSEDDGGDGALFCHLPGKRFTVFVNQCHFQIPGATLYLVAWQSRTDLSCVPALLIDVCMALRPLYVVIIPVLHGSMIDRSHIRVEYTLTKRRMSPFNVLPP